MFTVSVKSVLFGSNRNNLFEKIVDGKRELVERVNPILADFSMELLTTKDIYSEKLELEGMEREFNEIHLVFYLCVSELNASQILRISESITDNLDNICFSIVKEKNPFS